MLRSNCQATHLHDSASCWHPNKCLHAIQQHHGKLAKQKYPHRWVRGAAHTQTWHTTGMPFRGDAHRPAGQAMDTTGADDLHIVAAGEKHYETHLKAIRDTHIFITTAGGRIAASKSYAYSADQRTRKRLANTRYDVLQNAKVPAVTHSGDLGGQLNMTKRVMAPTRTKRIIKARRSIRKIGGIPNATRRKARLLRAKTFTQARYAASISPANKAELRTTQSAIINAVCPIGFSMRSPTRKTQSSTQPSSHTRYGFSAG